MQFAAQTAGVACVGKQAADQFFVGRQRLAVLAALGRPRITALRVLLRVLIDSTPFDYLCQTLHSRHGITDSPYGTTSRVNVRLNGSVPLSRKPFSIPRPLDIYCS